MNEATAITLFIYGLCCLSCCVAIWCTTWGLMYLFTDKTPQRASEGAAEESKRLRSALLGLYDAVEQIDDDGLEAVTVAARVARRALEATGGSFMDELPSWVCDRCSDIQPGSDTPHHYPPNHVCGDCYEVEQDARREGREDDRTGYQRRDGF